MSCHGCCSCCKEKVYGAPGFTSETCKSCGTEWRRYRLGSFDWQYKDCAKCEGKAYLKSLGIDTYTQEKFVEEVKKHVEIMQKQMMKKISEID